MGRQRALKGFGSATAIALVAATTSGCGIVKTGPAHPKPVSNWTVEGARLFSEFDVYWLGESYEGLPLTLVARYADGDGVNHAEFSYGDLSYFGDAYSGSWLAPLEIDIESQCGFARHEVLSNEELDDLDIEPEFSGDVEIRGAFGHVARYKYDWDYLTLWSGTVVIHLNTTPDSESDVERAARHLIPIADDGGATLKPLPPRVSSSC